MVLLRTTVLHVLELSRCRLRSGASDASPGEAVETVRELLSQMGIHRVIVIEGYGVEESRSSSMWSWSGTSNCNVLRHGKMEGQCSQGGGDESGQAGTWAKR